MALLAKLSLGLSAKQVYSTHNQFVFLLYFLVDLISKAVDVTSNAVDIIPNPVDLTSNAIDIIPNAGNPSFSL